jgi:hypothetical protein
MPPTINNSIGPSPNIVSSFNNYGVDLRCDWESWVRQQPQVCTVSPDTILRVAEQVGLLTAGILLGFVPSRRFKFYSPARLPFHPI